MRCLILTVLLIALTFAAEQEHCRALVLSGGGDKGSYQAGALYEIIHHHADETVQWDIITGISAGSMNGASLSNFAKGDEIEAAEFLVALWRGLTQEQLIKAWSWGGIMRGIYYETGLYDNAPGRDFGRKTIVRPKRAFIYGYVDAETGLYKTSNTEDFTNLEDYLNGVTASTTVPGIFPAMKDLVKGKAFIDGGVARNYDIPSAIDYCLKKVGGDFTKITLDVILLSNGAFRDDDAGEYKTIPMLMRYFEIRDYYGNMDLLLRAREAYKSVNWRYVLTPTERLSSGKVPLFFEPEEMENNIQIGMRDARTAIAMGEGKSAQYLVDYSIQRIQG